MVQWELRESMTEAEVEIVLRRARENLPQPRIISDNGPQFIARAFKEFIRICMTYVRTSSICPRSNGTIEHWRHWLKGEGIRAGALLSVEDARRLVAGYVDLAVGCGSTASSGTSHPRQTGRPHRSNLGAPRSETGGPGNNGNGGGSRPSRRSGDPTRWPRAATRTKLNPPGETEASSAGEQPVLRDTLWAHGVDESGASHPGPAGPTPHSRFYPSDLIER
jgi:hypothetical protein